MHHFVQFLEASLLRDRFRMCRDQAQTPMQLAIGDASIPHHLIDSKSVVWRRDYSDSNPDQCKCDLLDQVLKSMPHDARRMVMGHTIQTQGINSACGGQALRVDVGMSKGCRDGTPEVRATHGLCFCGCWAPSYVMKTAPIKTCARSVFLRISSTDKRMHGMSHGCILCIAWNNALGSPILSLEVLNCTRADYQMHHKQRHRSGMFCHLNEYGTLCMVPHDYQVHSHNLATESCYSLVVSWDLSKRCANTGFGDHQR